MTQEPKPPFGAQPGDLQAMLAAFDQLPEDQQAGMLAEIEAGGDPKIDTRLVGQELVAQGIAQQGEDTLDEARKKARSLTAAAEQIPGLGGILGLLAEDGRKGTQAASVEQTEEPRSEVQPKAGSYLSKKSDEGDTLISNDNGKSWWVEHSAITDLHYTGPYDVMGYYLD